MRTYLLAVALAVCACSGARAAEPACLPEGIKSGDIVSVERLGPGPGQVARRVTVGDKLKQLKARCRRGRLLDRKGRPIYFYRLTGCWGNPPADYLDILQRQRDELAKLRRRYTVVEMTCNPSAELIP